MSDAAAGHTSSGSSAGGGSGRQLYNRDTNNFAPNVGLAWDVFGNGKTAIRGASGVFYNFFSCCNYPYNGAAKGRFANRTTSVGSYQANAWGLHDMHGNVWEWCWDVFRHDYYKKSPASDPRGPKPRKPELSLRRVVRGGSWYASTYGDSGLLESSHREFRDADGRSSTLGFRVARGQHRS